MVKSLLFAAFFIFKFERSFISKLLWVFPTFFSTLGIEKSISKSSIFIFKTPKDFPISWTFVYFSKINFKFSKFSIPKTSISKSLTGFFKRKSRTQPPTRYGL